MTAPTDELQRALGDAYTLERELGRGGMGAVFLARDNRLQRPVAIKLLPPDLATNADLRERFLRETRLAASFSHPNIVPVHDVVERGNLLAFVMGYVDGETLGARVRRGGPMPLPDAVRVLQEVAWALSYAHGRGIVHRDIKPDNILIERATGRGLVTDFGIARSGVAPAPGQGLTRVGEVVGTPEFMSPEQASGDVVDGRSDLYSLGVVAFYILAGKLPFDAATPTGLLAMHLTQPPPPLSALRPDLPPEMVAAVERCLAKDPADRFASGEELANALDGLRRSAPEVAPAVRVFLQRMGTSFFAILFMGGCAVYLVRRGQKGGSDDWMIAFLMILAAAWGLLVQLIGRVRRLLRQGFRYRDVYAAAGAIHGEDVAARDAVRASSDEMRRRTKRIRVGLISCLWPPVAFWLVKNQLRYAVPGAPGQYRVGAPGAVIVVSAAVSLGLGITLLGSDPLKANPLAYVQSIFWRGPLGRLLFRIGGWRLPEVSDVATPVTGVMSSTPGGPLTLLLGLPKELKRDLRGIEARLAALESEIVTSRGREAQFAAALADAGTQRGTTSERATALVQELGDAASTAAREREAKELQLEHVRLELIRLRAGLGSAAAVRQALGG
ncbi:MAG: serine/threonine-protein kinase [Gemmatimonadales bacterium]